MTGTQAFENRVKLHQVFWFAVIVFGAFIFSFFLAFDVFTAFVATLGCVWLGLLPYHSRLAVYISVATFSSALILPFFPGRPYIWEFAALLGWSGLIVTISMRSYARDSFVEISRNRWLFFGVIGYCLVLLVTLSYRGVGLRILGSGQMGGRFYFQQLVCSIFPFLFIIQRPSEKTLIRLFIWQFVLTATFLISDFVLAVAPKELFVFLQFFELSGDAVNFEVQAMRSGLRRFQSLLAVSQGILFLMFIGYPIKDFFGRKGFLLLPLTLFALGSGLYSGHRILVLTMTIVFMVCAYAQRLLTTRHIGGGLFITGLLLMPVYWYAEDMPLSMQRAVSILPGISIQAVAADDGNATFDTRRLLRKIGMEMMPQYFWIGRGFGMSSAEDYSNKWDPTTVSFHVNQGRFYNGFIGLMVNTGVFGTFFMFLLIAAGTKLALNITQKLRLLGCHDAFLRMCGVAAGLWSATTVSFLFLHGDSEYALKSFSLMAGILVVCHWHLKARCVALGLKS